MFRKEAIEYQKNIWRGNALLLTGMPSWILAGISLFFFLTFSSFIILESFTRRVTVEGEVSTFPHAEKMFSNVQGVVMKQFVHEGDNVTFGDPIYQINVSKTTLKGVVSENQRKHIEEQLIRIQQIITHLKDNKKTTILMLENQKKQYSDSLLKSEKIVDSAREGVRLMKDNMENYKSYQIKGLINKDQLNNQASLYYQQLNNIMTLQGQNEQNKLQITSLESQIQTKSDDFDNQIYEMELQEFDLKKEQTNIDSLDTIVVRAMSDGKVDSLSVTSGEMVNVGDSLLQIIPAKIEHYFLILWIPNDALPYIKIGDTANIRYEAFPPQKFGQFQGKIISISKSPATTQEMLTYQGSPKQSLTTGVPYYKVIVIPNKTTITYGLENLKLENGMKAKSTLFLERRKIYQWMLSPFYDMKLSAKGFANE